MLFDDYRIDETLKENIAALGYKRPTDIQFKAIPSILAGEDLLAVAQTGTGKTAAYLIPLINMISKLRQDRRYSNAPKCLVLVPTHELAEQVAQACKQLCKHIPIKITALYGGKEQDEQIKSLKSNNGIVIATPGRMFDLRSQGFLNLEYIQYLVLDEADKMLFQGFLKDIKDLLKLIPKNRQTLFFSATINREIKEIAYGIINQKAIRIQLSPRNPASNNVTHRYVKVSMDDKRYYLERLLLENETKKILVFVRTKVRAERVYKAMERAGIETMTLHGDKTQEERESIIAQFENDECKVMIATDVAARGLDFKAIDIVINYDIPDQAENYVHRIGRSGRAKNKGLAYSFLSSEEDKYWKPVIEFLGYEPDEVFLSSQEIEDTITFSNQFTPNLKALLTEIDDDEAFKKAKKKKHKK